MSDIKLVRPHSLPLTKAKALAQKTADALAAEYDLESEWHGNILRFHRSGVDGQMHVTDSEIRLDVKLGLLLKVFRERSPGTSSATLTNCWRAARSRPKKPPAESDATRSDCEPRTIEEGLTDPIAHDRWDRLQKALQERHIVVAPKELVPTTIVGTPNTPSAIA